MKIMIEVGEEQIRRLVWLVRDVLGEIEKLNVNIEREKKVFSKILKKLPPRIRARLSDANIHTLRDLFNENAKTNLISAGGSISEIVKIGKVVVEITEKPWLSETTPKEASR
jgi:uncharacterized protein YgbK (DUF1537 family)